MPRNPKKSIGELAKNKTWKTNKRDLPSNKAERRKIEKRRAYTARAVAKYRQKKKTEDMRVKMRQQ